ncbi:hypothetical protein [Nannocystis pusilla]|uniref:Uncharacterized protein n=1 Tax=Nannocystis pusilla TaxID=889268 RepID=A0ABS7U064_9BACT|nr:hypothetical protein [Nannocystis pusilla]MBZ5713801.1 hypothetical protein [Nannocystis pusilla]
MKCSATVACRELAGQLSWPTSRRDPFPSRIEPDDGIGAAALPACDTGGAPVDADR